MLVVAAVPKSPGRDEIMVAVGPIDEEAIRSEREFAIGGERVLNPGLLLDTPAPEMPETFRCLVTGLIAI
ncbi:MAG: hypothetical protein JNL67_06355 [Planctomycetaceae bacterium]|nr:hypothetical protein [Planctomycetaceae bacterium]